MILLKNPRRCPRCHRDAVSHDNHRCVSCGVRLMRPNSDFARLHQEEAVEFFLWSARFGWIHSSHLTRGMAPYKPDFDPAKIKTNRKGEPIVETV